MRRITRVSLSILGFSLLVSSALAQGSGSSAPRAMDPPGAYDVSKIVTGKVQEVDREKGALVIAEERSGNPMVFKVVSKTARFLGAKGYSWETIEVGQRVRVEFKPQSYGAPVAEEIKLLKPKKM